MEFLDICQIFLIFFLDFFWIFLNFWIILDFFIFLFFSSFFSLFFLFLSKLIRLLLNVIMVTTGHQKLLKIGQNSIKSSFFARRAKKASAEGRSPPQELEVGLRSGPYLLVRVIKLFPFSL